MRATAIDCSYCESRHMPRFLCDPAKAILEAMAARAAQMNMPTIDFAQAPIPESADTIMSQVVIKAGVLPMGGHKFPVLVFSGRDQHQKALPNWTYGAEPAAMLKLKELICSRIDVAIASAAAP